MMDWMSFVVELTRALAWPIALFAVVWVARAHLGAVVERVVRVKFGESEIELSKKADEIAEHLPTTKPMEDATISRLSKYKQIAEISPRAAIVEAWNELEEVIGNILGERRQANQPFSKLLKDLAQGQKISDELVTAMKELRELRNRAIHNSSAHISIDDVIAFASLAQRIELTLKLVAPTDISVAQEKAVA